MEGQNHNGTIQFTKEGTEFTNESNYLSQVNSLVTKFKSKEPYCTTVFELYRIVVLTTYQ